MKKLMKAIAFATVMCMLLSTAAFAANKAELTSTDYVVAVKVETSAQEAEQLALLIVKAGTTLSELKDTDIAYVDQKATEAVTTSDSTVYTADFGNVTIADTFDAVDVYAGYASANSTTAPVEVGKNISLKNVKAITVSVANKAQKSDIMSEAKDAVGAAVSMDVTFANNDGRKLSKIIWALDTTTHGRVYTKSVVATGYEVLNGAYRIAAAINNGSDGVAIDTINSFDAIFLFTDDADAEYSEEVFTNPNDNTDAARGKTTGTN